MTSPVNAISQNDEQVGVHGPGTIFTCFTRLASELRYKIWKIAATQLPWILALRKSRTTRKLGDLGCAFTVLQRGKSSQPSLLQVNRKSRREAIGLYEFIMGTQFHGKLESVHFGRLLSMWSISPETSPWIRKSHVSFSITTKSRRLFWSSIKASRKFQLKAIWNLSSWRTTKDRRR
jgi:hypothetical protein